jgi:hypothetical protein
MSEQIIEKFDLIEFEEACEMGNDLVYDYQWAPSDVHKFIVETMKDHCLPGGEIIPVSWCTGLVFGILSGIKLNYGYQIDTKNNGDSDMTVSDHR